MDKIYSRRRFCFYKVNNSFDDRKKTKILKFLVIIVIAILVFKSAMNIINPMIDVLCRDKAKSVATVISNEQASKVMEKYEYDDLMTIFKDKNDNITMIKANIVSMNKIISDITLGIQKELDLQENQNIYLNVGAFSGSKLFSGSGPKIPIKIYTVGDIVTEFKSEFVSAGINQTIHRIYLEIDCNVKIVTPYENISEKISNQVILTENLIVGVVPSTYYNLDGVNKDNILDTVR